MDELIDRLVASLPFEPPYAFFGHSMGAVLAFELARRVQSQGLPGPLCLFASGCPAPQYFAVTPRVHDLPEREFLDRLRSLNGTPAVVLENPELREILLPVIRADFEVCETYQYTHADPVPWPIFGFAGDADPEVPVWQLDAWQDRTRVEFRRQIYPGGHFFLHEHREQMLGVIRTALARVWHEHMRTTGEASTAHGVNVNSAARSFST